MPTIDRQITLDSSPRPPTPATPATSAVAACWSGSTKPVGLCRRMGWHLQRDRIRGQRKVLSAGQGRRPGGSHCQARLHRSQQHAHPGDRALRELAGPCPHRRNPGRRSLTVFRYEMLASCRLPSPVGARSRHRSCQGTRWSPSIYSRRLTSTWSASTQLPASRYGRSSRRSRDSGSFGHRVVVRDECR
jgi:hypothetical protein